MNEGKRAKQERLKREAKEERETFKVLCANKIKATKLGRDLKNSMRSRGPPSISSGSSRAFTELKFGSKKGKQCPAGCDHNFKDLSN